MNESSLRRKIHACWLGKAVGGTLGAPHEGRTGPLDLAFYDPAPCGVLPNDDLDLQVVWLHHLRSFRFGKVTPEILSDAWGRHVLFPYDEYGIQHRNRIWGLRGSAQGAIDNFFGECMGAAIRTEVWACIAPGQPGRAAALAWADAVVDHTGDGVWAAVFHAALQSQAFVDQDRDRLLACALSFLPRESRLRSALEDTIAWWHTTRDWRRVRSQVLARYATGNFTDVVCNLCWELLGWYEGGDDFGHAICTAVNCGLDTDCTGATLGALLAIIDPEAVPARWREPIGEDLVLSAPIVGFTAPANLAELTEWTLEVRKQLDGFSPTIGHVAAHAPADAGNAVRPLGCWVSQGQSSAPVSALGHHGLETFMTLYGHWSRWKSEAMDGKCLRIRIPISVPESVTPELMVYFAPGATAWIDGKEVLSYDQPKFLSDPMGAPSFHRAGPMVTRLFDLKPGRHELVMALMPVARDRCEDLVFGLGDSATHHWLPYAFSSSSA